MATGETRLPWPRPQGPLSAALLHGIILPGPVSPLALWGEAISLLGNRGEGQPTFKGKTMSQPIEFDATIEDAGGGGTFVTVPFDVEAAFGKKRVKVKATIDGVPYRGSLMRMGGPCHMLGVLKEIRDKVGKGPGDQVHVVVEEDTEPRLVEVPEDLRHALDADPNARRFFDGLSYTHQREYVSWIVEAKRAETRQNRILKAIDMLRQGTKAR